MIASQPHLVSLATNWRAAEDIDRDVDALNTTIHGLIQALGMDPTEMDGAHAEEGHDGNDEADGGVVSNGGPGRGGGRIGNSSNSNTTNTGLDFETLLSAWNNGNGSSESTTTRSTSTPSTGEDADGTGFGADEGDDMMNISSPSVPHAAIPYSKSDGAAVVAGGSGGGSSPPRPINKKARTSMTASATTSAGAPMKVEPAGAGGKKRRSAVVDATTLSGLSSGAGGGDGAEGLLDAVDAVGGSVEPAQMIGQDQQGVQTRSSAKSKKRRG
jgi:hypothetical protein